MTYEQYWYGDPQMVRAYYRADRLRMDRMDEEAWLHGMYVMSALNATVGNMFRKQGQQPVEYPKEPVSFSEKKRKREKTEEEEEQEALWALAWMNSFVQAGKNWGKNKQAKG